MRALLPILPFLLAAPVLGNAEPLTVQQIRVEAAVVPAAARLTPRVRLLDRADGSRVIEVQLENLSGREVELAGAEVQFPWDRPADSTFRVAAGAMATGRWPPLLVSDPAKDRAEPVSGMYLLAGREGRYSLAAFVSWQTFWSKLRYRAGTVVMTADGEGRRLRAGETVTLERIRLAEGADWQDLLFGYADAIARELHLAPKPPRRFVGWSTWDYYGRGFRAADVRGNVEALPQLLPEANLVQIDGGWWRERGDFTGAREDLGPDAMKAFATDFRKRGLTAGIHLDGMRVSERSAVARQHPEFFLHDDRGGLLRETNGAGGDGPYLFFDYSHPAACAYMRDALRRLRREWGYDYIKIDYLRAGIAEDLRLRVLGTNSLRHLVPHDPGLTSVERFHRAMTAFRQGMGDDAWFLACSTPFGPTFGYVDALRTGPDISPRFPAYESQCEANAGNFYFHGKVVQVDADYLVVRAKGDQDATLVKDRSKDGGNLALNEAEMWAAYEALCSGPKIASDNLMILREDRKALVRFAAGQSGPARFVPLDYWQHARNRTDAFHAFLSETGREVCLLLLNWNDTARTYHVTGLPVGSALTRGNPEVSWDRSGAQVTLASHRAAVFRLPAGTGFDQARKSILVE